MRQILLAAAFVGALVSAPGAAAAAQIRFLGGFTVTSVKNCLSRYIGETFNSSFRPAGIGDNPDLTSLSQLTQYSGDIYELPAATFPLNRWAAVSAHGITNVHYSFSARIRITRQVPATLDARTNAVELAGYIERMGGDPGAGGTCVAGFRGSWYRRVE